MFMKNSTTYYYLFPFISLLLFLITLFYSVTTFAQDSFIPAFPGAEGGGAGTVGGRGGQVYEVTNLNDSGQGSLRYGIDSRDKKSPLIIVFKVGGQIDLQSSIKIEDDAYITIAGQTAPGEGITLSGKDTGQSLLIIEQSHDVVIRYLKVRHGLAPPEEGQNDPDGIEIINSHDVIIDHTSVTWAHDENIGIKGTVAGNVFNITVQNSILAEGLSYDNHANGILVHSNHDPDLVTDISIIKNYFSHNNNRNPQLNIKSADIINNIVYDWEWWATGIVGGIEVDIIGNHYEIGNSCCRGSRREILFQPHSPNNSSSAGDPSIYFENNTGPNNIDAGYDAWLTMLEMTLIDSWGAPLIDGVHTITDIPQTFRRAYPRASGKPNNPFTYNESQQLENLFMSNHGVGASQRLNEYGQWIANRDATDTRLISNYINGTGQLVNRVVEPGDDVSSLEGIHYIVRPVIVENINSYADEDHDGMPDIWEQNNGFNKTLNDGIEDADGDGYTNVEEFLNGTNPRLGAETPYVVFHFDETNAETIAEDSTGNGFNAKVLGTAFNSSTEGKINSAIELNGNDQRLLISDKLINIGSGDFTLMAWIYLDTPEHVGVVAIRPDQSDIHGRARMGISEDGRLQYGIYGGISSWTTTSGPILNNGWHHIAISYDRDANATAYVDGQVVGARDISSTKDVPLYGRTFIGYDGFTVQKYFDGRIDEVKVFRRALTANDVITASQKMFLPSVDGLVSIEAENYHQQDNGNHWQSFVVDGLSGGEAVMIADNTLGRHNTVRADTTPRLDYKINFNQTGIYYVWVRGQAPDYSGDSIHIGLNESQYNFSEGISYFAPYNQLSWSNERFRPSTSNIATINVEEAGIHTLNAWMREDGFIFDKIILTKDPNYLPLEDNGLGPQESAQSY